MPVTRTINPRIIAQSCAYPGFGRSYQSFDDPDEPDETPPAGRLPGQTTSERVKARPDAHALGEAVGCLSTLDRVVMQLLIISDLSLRDAARQVGLPLGTLAWRKLHLRKRLDNPTVTALLHAREFADPLARDIALRHHLGGQSQRHIAAELRLTRRMVSEKLIFVRGWARATRPARVAVQQT